VGLYSNQQHQSFPVYQALAHACHDAKDLSIWPLSLDDVVGKVKRFKRRLTELMGRPRLRQRHSVSI